MPFKTDSWLITGCSSGIGRALAARLIAECKTVFATGREPATLDDLIAGHDNATALKLDVTIPKEVTAVRDALEAAGGIDVLVNNAGFGYRAAIEEGDDDPIADLFATNVTGAVAMTKAVLPLMRARRSGTIVNITSMAAHMVLPGSGYYAATKAALEGVSDALRGELAPLGIRVLIVEPGPFRTEYSSRSLLGSEVSIADYDETVGPRRKENDRSHGTQSDDPDRAAKVLAKVVAGETLPARLLLGSAAVKGMRLELEARLREIAEWEDISSDTDFKDPT